MTDSTSADLDRIVALTFDYAMALDTKNWDGLVACFTPDGILRTSFSPTPFVGREGIREGMARITADIIGNLHPTSNHQYVIDGDQAHGTAIFVSYQWIGDPSIPGNYRIHAGRYFDKLVRLDSVWMFADRHINLMSKREF